LIADQWTIHQNVIVTPYSILQHCVECGTLFPAFCTTDAVVLVGLDDQPVAMSCHSCQDEPLILSGLIVTADPQVDRRAKAIGAHSSPRNYIRMIAPIPILSSIACGVGLCQMGGDGDGIATERIQESNQP
jgi:hypothetical protein